MGKTTLIIIAYGLAAAAANLLGGVLVSSRKLGQASYAIYGAVDLAVSGTSRDALRKMTWIGFDEEHAYMPGQAWIHDLLEGKRPVIRTNDWQILAEATRSGAGLSVLRQIKLRNLCGRFTPKFGRN